MLYTGYHFNGPAAVRYPRGGANGDAPTQTMTQLEVGKAVVKRQSEKNLGQDKVAILSYGTLLPNAMAAAQALDASVVDMRFIKPFDQALVNEMARTHDVLVTLEENAIIGGAGSAITQHIMHQRLSTPVLNLGLPDRFVCQGTQEEQQAMLALDCAGITKQINDYLAQ